MGVKVGNETERVRSSGKGSDRHNERYWVCDRQCLACGAAIEFYRYPNRKKPEPRVCAPCAAKRWARQGNRPSH